MKNGNRSKTVRISIIVLAILLAISATALAGTVIYRHFTRSQSPPAVSPDNVITPEKTASTPVSTVQLTTLSYRTVSTVQAAPMAVRTISAKSAVVDQADGENVTLKIYRNHAEDSTPFQVNNMFPGDSETKNYYLEVSYKNSNITGYAAVQTWSANSKITLENCTLTGVNKWNGNNNDFNTVTVVNNAQNAVVTLKNCAIKNITNGTAKQYFFGICAEGATVTATGCTYENNSTAVAASDVSANTNGEYVYTENNAYTLTIN